jgi:hypothetical protein
VIVLTFGCLVSLCSDTSFLVFINRRIMLTRSARRLLGRTRSLARYHNEAPLKPAHLSASLCLQGSNPPLNGDCSGFSKQEAFSGHRMHSTTGFRVAEPMQLGMTEMMPDLAPSPSDIRYDDLIITRSKHLQVCAFRELRWKRGHEVHFSEISLNTKLQCSRFCT